MNQGALIIVSDPMPRHASKRKRRPFAAGGTGARVAQARRERGLSQGELAEAIRVTQRIVSFYETGNVRIPAETLLKIAEVLKVSVYELLGRAASSRSPKNPRLWKALRKVEALPRRDQRAVLRYIELLAGSSNGNGRGSGR